jgi:hypothetical protein
MLIFISLVTLYACNGSSKIDESDKMSNQEVTTKDEIKVSMMFIGQTYSRSSNDSFGNTKETFSFEKNGKGAFVSSHSTQVPLNIQRKYNKYSNQVNYEDRGHISWEIINGEIYVYYSYHASDGVVSREKAIFKYDEVQNRLISTEYDSVILNSVSSKSSKVVDNDNKDDIDSDNEVFNREQAEYESNQGYYLSGELTESIMTFKECMCGAQDCVLLFIDQEGKKHEFYQNEITTYDFGCPNGLKYKNKRFKIQYKPISIEYDEFVSIELF